MTIKWFSVKLKNAPVNSFYWTVFRILFLKMHKKIWILPQGSHISLSYSPGVKEEGSIMFWIATSSWYTRNEIRENDKKNQRIKTLQKWGDHHILMCEVLRGHITVQSVGKYRWNFDQKVPNIMKLDSSNVLNVFNMVLSKARQYLLPKVWN